MDYIENNSADPNGNTYLVVDSLIKINNIITASNNIILRKVYVKSYGFDKTYMEKRSNITKFCQIVHQLNDPLKIVIVKIIHKLYCENGRKSTTLLANDDKNNQIYW